MSHIPVIRKAEIKDSDILVRFNTAMALETEQKKLEDDLITKGVKALFNNPEYGFYIVAEVQGQVVGSLMITKEWSDWRNGLFWWIQSVYVIPEFRRKGIFSKMYHKIQEMAKYNPEICGFRLYVEKENATAQKTYLNLGMNETNYKMYEAILED